MQGINPCSWLQNSQKGSKLGVKGDVHQSCSLRDWLIPLAEQEEIANPEPTINYITYHSTYIGNFDTNYIIFANARGVPLAQLKRASKTELSTVILELSLTTHYISFHAVVEISGEFIHQTHNNQLGFTCSNAIQRICDLY
jgi:hypothetical protein